jgi:tetratricopeptide (TPR) repeat protein
MFTFLKRLLGIARTDDIDTELEIEESWKTDFRKHDDARFVEETGESYATRIAEGGLVLSLLKKNVYAWTVDPLYRYRDFVLEGLVEFPRESGTSTIQGDATASGDPQGTPGGDGEPYPRAGSMAAGFLFRYLTESTFYAVLVSDRGMVRMDVVINGTPVPILGWTETRRGNPDIDVGPADADAAPYLKNDRLYAIRVIARATSFTLIVNDAWVAECADDTIQAAGKIAFAAQNWDSGKQSEATLSGIAIDSAPMEVETVYSRWNQFLPIAGDAHAALARTWYAMGKYVPAIIELKRAWKARPADAEELLLSGQAFLAQRLYAEAEDKTREALALDGSNPAAVADLGGILYLQNRFAELDGLLQTVSAEAIADSPFLANLEGHLLAWKGLHAEAAEAYLRAARRVGDQGLFYLHAGNEYGSAGFPDKAIDAWLGAARVFLSASEYDDLADAVDRLLEAASDDPRTLGLAGKYQYAVGNEKAAAEYLERAVALGTGDSAAWYLHGMILAARGDTPKAIAAFRKATELEDGYGLYHFRLAETLFNSGEDCSAELARALETGSDNGWAWNLAAMRDLAAGDLDAAERNADKARRLLPGELAPLVNHAEIWRREGRLDEALALFDPNDPDSLHAQANLLVEDGRHEEAEELYVQALRHHPFDAELLTDRAANCIEIDLLSEADDLLGRAIEIESSPRVYKLIAYLSGRKGEYVRAEVALQRGLEEFPDATELLFELASVYNATGKRDKAAETARRLRELDDSPRARELCEEIAESATYRIDCSACGRHWRVPKDIPPQGSLRLTAEPPDELPAGTCPTCQTNYCIGCARKNLGEDGRFRCATCGQPLKLVNQGIIWILAEWQKGEAARERP